MAPGVCRFHLQSSRAGNDAAPRIRSRGTARRPTPSSRRVIRPLISRPGAAPEGDLAIDTRGGGNAYLADADSTGGGGPNISNGGGSGGGGGGDEGGSHDGMPGALTALLMAAGRTVESLPAGFAAAVKEGKASREALELFLKLERNPLMRPFLGIAGFRERLMADPGFFVKLGIELGIGLVCKITAEAQKRGESFKSELDFVFANVVMALIADFMLVWLPAPTLSYGAKKAAQQSKLSSFLGSCPDNAFQVVPAGKQPWSLAQRSAAVGRNGAKLLGVGFGASMFGVTITNVLLEIRKKIDPEFKVQNPPQNVLAMSAGYAVYMASSSNLRYQILAGVVEERGIERMLHGNAVACGIASFIVRTGNTYLGSLLWVDFLRLVGLQKKAETAKK